MAKLRADAIASLNKPVSAVVETPQTSETKKAVRKPRGPNKAKVNMGPSEPPSTAQSSSPTEAQKQAAFESIPDHTTGWHEVPKGTIASVTQTVPPAVVSAQVDQFLVAKATAPAKPRLSSELVKPFRQRLFKIVNDHLEPNGFAPKEGKGNADKMRDLANIMFPDVANLSELTVEQWEKYLTTLETKITNEGAKVAIKYIEDTVGI
jgi:hypothetical protein